MLEMTMGRVGVDPTRFLLGGLDDVPTNSGFGYLWRLIKEEDNTTDSWRVVRA